MSLPNPAKLSLTSPRAADDLKELGFDHEPLMWTLAGTGDPDLALNAAHRFMQASGAQWPTVRECLINEPVVRTRFLALLGGSTALADHLIAHPQLWQELRGEIPDAGEALRVMLLSLIHI